MWCKKYGVFFPEYVSKFSTFQKTYGKQFIYSGFRINPSLLAVGSNSLPLPTDFLSFKATNNLTGKLAGALVHCQMVTRFEIGSCVRTADVPWHSNLKT